MRYALTDIDNMPYHVIIKRISQFMAYQKMVSEELNKNTSSKK